MKWPVIPFFIQGTFRRCRRRSAASNSAADPQRRWRLIRRILRVAIIGTGSFSLEVFGPRIRPGFTDGVPDPEWVHEVCRYLDGAATPMG